MDWNLSLTIYCLCDLTSPLYTQLKIGITSTFHRVVVRLNGLKHVKPLEQWLIHSQHLVILTIFLTTTIRSTTSVNITTYHTER